MKSERKRTGIGSLKIWLQSSTGYYIEISNPNLHLAPADFERKQTLVNAERFTTPELKEYERKVLDAPTKASLKSSGGFLPNCGCGSRHGMRGFGGRAAIVQLDVLEILLASLPRAITRGRNSATIRKSRSSQAGIR